MVETGRGKLNLWAGTNVTRSNNPEYDKIHNQAKTELDPEVQAELFIAMNDLSVNDFVEVPIVHRAAVACVSNRLTGYVGTMWATNVYDIKN